MRKIAMKRRSRVSKVDNEESAKDDQDEMSNGDTPEKNERKRKSRRSEENGRENGDKKRKDESEEESEPEESEEEEKVTKKKKGKADDEPEAKKRRSKKVSEDEEESEEEQDTKKKEKKGKKGRKSKTEVSDDDVEEEEKEKKGKKQAAKKKEESKEDEEEDYEVEAIVGDRKVRSVTQYKIRWKGYSSGDDTWEPERTLNCTELLQKYKEAKAKKAKKEDYDEDVDEKKEYEVDRIIEVHFRRDGKREFLVNWKGYPTSDNTWEPEENLNCADLIERFMSKVEEAKNIDQRTLRTYRMPTERFTLQTSEKGRRISKRNSEKQRIRYVDCE